MNAAIQIIEQIGTKCKGGKKRQRNWQSHSTGKENLFRLPCCHLIAFIDIIYLAITIFPDLFSNQVVSLYAGEKWLRYSIPFVPLLEEIPYLPAHQKLYFQPLEQWVKNHHLQC